MSGRTPGEIGGCSARGVVETGQKTTLDKESRIPVDISGSAYRDLTAGLNCVITGGYVRQVDWPPDSATIEPVLELMFEIVKIPVTSIVPEFVRFELPVRVPTTSIVPAFEMLFWTVSKSPDPISRVTPLSWTVRELRVRLERSYSDVYVARFEPPENNVTSSPLPGA
jgi:hypothetical protein